MKNNNKNSQNTGDNSEVNSGQALSAENQGAPSRKRNIKTPKKSSSKLMPFLMLITVLAVIYYAYITMSHPEPKADEQTDSGLSEVVLADMGSGEPSSEAAPQNVTVSLGLNSAPVAASSGGAVVDVQLSNNPLVGKNADSVLVPVRVGGRIDPFRPSQLFMSSASRINPAYIAPPDFLEIDPEEVTRYEDLTKTTVSGIMYDKQRPSAIINIKNMDHLVHKGDRIDGYQILDIVKEYVVVKMGSNIYRASVGQELASNNAINFNPVSNVNRQFGGAYRAPLKNVIEINGN